MKAVARKVGPFNGETDFSESADQIVLLINGQADHDVHTEIVRPDVEKLSRTLTDPGFDLVCRYRTLP